jgi:hypothetical protein
MTDELQIGRATGALKTKNPSRAQTLSGDHIQHVNQKELVAGNPSSAAKSRAENPVGAAALEVLIGQIVEQWRRRQDMLRAHQRLNLQAQAVCRRFVDGDKVAAGKLWAKVRDDPAHDLRMWLGPFLLAMEPLEGAQREIERQLAKLAKQLPCHAWALGVRGLGDVSLAAIVGECGIGPGEFRSVSALWKRMGLAVIGGGRQRRITGDAALEHGYSAQRRALLWNIGGNIIKGQIRSEKGEDGKKLEGTSFALGELGQVYLDRKAYLVARNASLVDPWSPLHIHNDAKRYMEKRLLRQLWAEWRRATLTA